MIAEIRSFLDPPYSRKGNVLKVKKTDKQSNAAQNITSRIQVSCENKIGWTDR
jgi:hypothetical protein